MAKTFEYQVCAMQNGRITFVNGEWQGTIAPEDGDPNAALETCPVVWSYLDAAGRQGWELRGAINQPLQDVHLQTIFLMREIVSDAAGDER